MTGTKVGQLPYVTMGGEVYHLALKNGAPVFSSGTRALEGVPSDAFELRFKDWSKGLGRSFADVGVNGMLTVIKNKLWPPPTVARIDVSAVGTVDKPFRHSFEAQDTNGRWYLFVISPEHIAKIDIGVDPPVLRRVYDVATTGNLAASDRFGQPVQAYDSGSLRWYIPLNSGDRVAYIADPVSVDTGAGSADTFTVFTTVTKGAAHFKQLPSGKIWRAVSSHSAGTFQKRAEISVLQAGADFQTDNNWGEDFPVDSQTRWIVGLQNFGERLQIRKQDGWFRATENADKTIDWETLLPDGGFAEFADLDAERTHVGGTWHGVSILPTPNALWRSNIYSHLPVGPESINDGAEGDFHIQASLMRSDSLVSTVAPAGKWIWAANNKVAGSRMQILAGRAAEQGEGPGEITWFPIYVQVNSLAANTQFVHVQRNGEGATRLWFSEELGGFPSSQDQDLAYITIGRDGSPFTPDGTYGNTGVIDTQDTLLPSKGLFTEARMLIESGDANMAWSIIFFPDGDTANSLTTTLTATGSIFWTAGTRDTGRRVRFRVIVTDGGYTDAYPPPELREMIVSGFFLPDVGETLSFVVDVEKTAEEANYAQETVVANLKALRKSAATSYIDRFGTASQFVLVKTTDEGAAKRVAGIEGENLIGITAELLEYS